MGKKKYEDAMEDLPIVAEEIGLEADELPVLPVETGDEEAAVDEPVTEPANAEPVIDDAPTADLLFDMDEANRWLNDGSRRRTKTYTSIRFDAIGLSERRTLDAVRLAAEAIKVGGTLFIPDSLLYAPDTLSFVMARQVDGGSFVEGEIVGSYTAFHRAI